jgi:hypothetical protein
MKATASFRQVFLPVLISLSTANGCISATFIQEQSGTEPLPETAERSSLIQPQSSTEARPQTTSLSSPLQQESASQARSAAVKWSLKPGKFIWYPKLSPRGPVVIIISLPNQLAYVYRNGILIGVSTVSTGMPGYETPTGVFTILDKRRHHLSNLYEGAEMPYMQRLTWDGIALHGGHLPGYPASHGCIRLPLKFSKLLFGITTWETTVMITDAHAAPPEALPPSLLLFSTGFNDNQGIPMPKLPIGEFVRQPERSLYGSSN